MYSVPLPISVIRTRIRQEFERNRFVNKLNVVDVLITKGHADYQVRLHFIVTIHMDMTRNQGIPRNRHSSGVMSKIWRTPKEKGNGRVPDKGSEWNIKAFGICSYVPR